MSKVDPKTALASAGLTDTEIRCLAWYYFDGLTQEEIAEKWGISRPRVSQYIKLAEVKLKEKGFARRKYKHGRTIVMDPRVMDRLSPGEIKQSF